MFVEFERLIRECEQKGFVVSSPGGTEIRTHVAVNPPATLASVEACERELGLPLPPSYRQFLLRWDGARLYHDDQGAYAVRLLGCNDLVRENQTMASWPPHKRASILPFAWVPATGGDRLGFNASVPASEYPVVDCHQALSPVHWLQRTIAESFSHWLRKFVEGRGQYFWLEKT